ncbi:MAG TPA: alpha-D-ribose 1-methylphosphonate 5-triphosphate diphosphatase [Devosiaceae bacterium]|nr:alpha-D-ribose 1-methylphosphonate 5-triphosphate diphosphatase [Devosiaceae bacterium]
MQSDLVIRNAKIVLADEVIAGSLAVEDGAISAIDLSHAETGIDFGGDYLIPGLVELHTDHLENHYRPRPGVYWNPMAALQAHDTQIAGSGITTVFDALRIGSDVEMPGMGDHVDVLLGAVMAAQEDGRLRADHMVHLRCELPTPDVVEHFERFCDLPIVKLASVMDHTPGQRQFQTIEKFREYYQERMRFSDAEMDAYIADRYNEQAQYSDKHRKAIVKRGKAVGIAFASHDDATAEQVAESVADGVSIAEFPTTLVAAEASHKAGLAVLMGAPNVVRGKSHSGNISATELAKHHVLDVLSSDYVPFALMQAAFLLPQRAEEVSLPEAIAMVSRNPAKAAGLEDRGEIAAGKRADFVRVKLIDGAPVVRGVWRQGERVS